MPPRPARPTGTPPPSRSPNLARKEQAPLTDSTWPVHPAANLFPLLDGDEYQQLVDDIRRHGLHEPVWLWHDPERGTVLLDGRNRVRACQEAGVEPVSRFYEGDEPTAFVVSLNVHRRHLTVGQKAALALKVLPALEAETPLGRPPKSGADLPHFSDKKRAPRSRDKAAAAVGVSGKAVAQAKRVSEQAPDLLEQVEAGELALDRAERIIRDREAEQRRIQQAKDQAAATPTPPTIDIRLGDFRHVLHDITGIDAIITDPPYPAEYLPLLADLAAWADKALTPDGVLAVLMGQTHLPTVYRLLDGHRPYRWTACYLTPGAAYVSYPRKVQSNWKPVLIYGGSKRFADTLQSEGVNADAKNLHEWGQDYNAFHTLVERITNPGDTIADPFMGAGTTLLAARALGRHGIGAELDPDHYATAKARLT